MKHVFALAIFLACSTVAHAEFVIEDADENGVTGPSDASWRFYQEQMQRFPDRVGIICYNAYILNKTPDHKAAFEFFSECAGHAHAASMINLAQFYFDGMGVEKNLATSTDWLRKAAETAHSSAEYEYGKALLNGVGVLANQELAAFWLNRAAIHGGADAAALLKKQRIPVVAWIE